MILAAWAGLAAALALSSEAAPPLVEVAYHVEQTTSLEDFRQPSCGPEVEMHAGACRYGKRVVVRRGGSLRDHSSKREALLEERRQLIRDPIRFAKRRGHSISARGRAKGELLIAGKSLPELESSIDAALRDLDAERASLELDRETQVSVLLSEVEGRYRSVLAFRIPEGFPFPLANLARWDFRASERIDRAGMLGLDSDGSVTVLSSNGLVRPLAAAKGRDLPRARGIWDLGRASAAAR